MSRLKEAGLQQQLPDDHPLIAMYRDVLAVTHPTQDMARDNYLCTCSRVFRYVDDRLRARGKAPSHWVDLLLAPDLVKEYLDK